MRTARRQRGSSSDVAHRQAVKPFSIRLSPTEKRHEASMHLDTMPLRAAVRLMLREEARVTRKLKARAQTIERAIRLIARAFRRGGRLLYAGAGTSGRLGVLDASECPPTFNTPPAMVQGIIAGGPAALHRAVEGAEDDSLAGGKAIASSRVRSRDVVLGITTSGTTPFVWGALKAAKSRGATTMLLSFNPYLRIPRSLRPSLVLTVDVGPELLTGSTRLKAGTATKLILNMLSTLSMVAIGKVMSNLMVDMRPANEKLRGRAVRIVCDLTGRDAKASRMALERSGWVIKDAAALILRRPSFRAR